MLKAFLSIFSFLLADDRGELDLAVLGQEIKSFTGEAKAALEKLARDGNETANRLLALEQKGSGGNGGGLGFGEKSIGELFIDSDGFKALQAGGRTSGQITIGSFHKS